MRIPFPRRGGSRMVHAAISDSHGGSVVGLLNPHHVLWRENPKTAEPEAWQVEGNEMSRYLWSYYMDHRSDVQDLAGDDPIVLSHAGDLTHGNKYPGHFKSLAPDDQWAIAFWNLQPWLEVPNLAKLILVTGTEAHDWMSTSSEVKVSQLIRHSYPDLDVQVVHHADATLGGVGFDIAHHGPSKGIRKWTEGNAALLYLKDRMMKARARGEVPARVYVRGHFHVDIHEVKRDNWLGDRTMRHIIGLPSYCGVNWHARQATKSDPELNTGMYAFEIEDGNLGIHPFIHIEDMRRKVEYVV